MEHFLAIFETRIESLNVLTLTNWDYWKILKTVGGVTEPLLKVNAVISAILITLRRLLLTKK